MYFFTVWENVSRSSYLYGIATDPHRNTQTYLFVEYLYPLKGQIHILKKNIGVLMNCSLNRYFVITNIGETFLFSE